MFFTANDLSTLLGVDAADIATGAAWHLPGDAGSGVTVSIARDEDGNLSIAASESVPGEDSAVIAWLAGAPTDDGFELSGHDASGEASNSDDPRSAAAAIRRQIHGIRSSLGGRKVA